MKVKTPRWFKLLFTVTLCLCLLSQACSQSTENEGRLVLTGSSTVAQLMFGIAERYQIDHPKVTIEIQTGGSNKGIEDVRQSTNDIGMVSRALKADESDLHVFTIAQDGISLLLHKANLIESLDRQQVIDIFTGKIDSWGQVGGPLYPITVLSQGANHATLDLFTEYFGISPDEIQAEQVLGDNEEVLKAVLDDPNAIAYVSIGAAEYQIVHGVPFKLLPIGGVAATIKNVGGGAFPLVRPLNLVTKEIPQGLKKDFIEFAQSPSVEDLIDEQAFVPAKPR